MTEERYEQERDEEEKAAGRTERILVALDASPTSAAALRAAAQLAAAMQVDLLGLFVEDDRLLRLCNTPFSREVGLYTAAVRPLESRVVERQLRVMAGEMRRQLARVATEMQVRWSFQVRRGGIEDELLTEAANALLLSLGRTSWLARHGLGSTARSVVQRARRPLLLLGNRERLAYPLTLVYTDSSSAQRALALAIRLSQQAKQPLRVLLVTTPTALDAMKQQLVTTLAAQAVEATLVAVTEDHSAQTIASAFANQALVLPIEYSDLLSDLKGPVLLVP